MKIKLYNGKSIGYYDLQAKYPDVFAEMLEKFSYNKEDKWFYVDEELDTETGEVKFILRNKPLV